MLLPGMQRAMKEGGRTHGPQTREVVWLKTGSAFGKAIGGAPEGRPWVVAQGATNGLAGLHAARQTRLPAWSRWHREDFGMGSFVFRVSLSRL